MKKLAYAIALAGAVLILGSCAGDAPAKADSGQTTNTTMRDIGQANQDATVWPDTSVQDQYIWPDTQSPVDTWPTPTDTSYAGTPFGCSSDADCFGRVCCPTPWGVKLCATECPDTP